MLGGGDGMTDSINASTWLCSVLMDFLSISICWISVAWADDIIDEISMWEDYHSYGGAP